MSRPGPLAALQAALAGEQAACYGYGIVGSHLTGERLAQASADWVTHQRARDSLSEIVTGLRARPQPAAAAYQLPIAVRTPADAVALAITLEHQVVAAYLTLAGQPEPALRRLAATRMQGAAVRAARWGGQSQAFPGLAGSG
jgi:hypothetical protein